MNDRDFKLLVREYFLVKSSIWYARGDDKRRKLVERKEDIEKRILSELELFTKEDVQELPFKD